MYNPISTILLLNVMTISKSDYRYLIAGVIKIACVDDFVKKLDNGPETILVEKGAGLTEGHMQRIDSPFAMRPVSCRSMYDCR